MSGHTGIPEYELGSAIARAITIGFFDAGSSLIGAPGLTALANSFGIHLI